MMDRDWALVGIGVLVVVLVFPAVCSDEPSPPGTVLLVGDSLLFQSIPAVTQALEADGWDVQTHAVLGAGLTGGGDPRVEWHAKVEELVDEHDPEVAVVELGTNGCGPGCESIPDAIDEIMQDLRTVPEVLWIDARQEAPQPPERAQIDQALRDATGRWENLTVVSFDSWFHGHPEYLVADGIHLSPQGQQALAAHIQDEIRKHADVDVAQAGR